MKKIIAIALFFVLAGSLPVQAQITNLLQNKTAREKANIKGTEIAKLSFAKYTDSTTGITVEIRDGKITQIDDGIEFYARAWKGVSQLGFGKDGSVEWERFRIFNPPILVNDQNGTIVRTWEDPIVKEIKTRKLIEDPLAAIKSTLAHTIKVSSKEGTNIIKGSFGNTTDTFFPAAGAVSPVDGIVGDNTVNQTWAQKIANVGEFAQVTNAVGAWVHVANSGTTNLWNSLQRGILLFDTSAISDGDTIDTATLSIAASGTKIDANNNAPNIDIYTSTPASNSNLVGGDFTQIGSTSQTGSPITYANWVATDGTYNNFTFNAIGRGNVSKTGLSKFGTRNANFDVAATAPIWAVDATMSFQGYQADQAGTANDPKLVVVHSAPLAPAEGNLWQKRSFEGKGFIVTTNEITVTPSAETNFVLIRNPAASSKLHRSNDFALTVRTEGQNVRLRIYKNPTVTSDGTPVTLNINNNVRTNGNAPVSLVFTSPIITSLQGHLIASYSRNADSINRSFDLSLYLEQGESYLITVQGTATGNDYMLTYTFVEE